MIGKNILEIRKRRGLTLTEVANRAGVAKSYLSNIERNVNQNPSIQVVERIALVLNVDLKTLVASETNHDFASSKLDAEWMKLIHELKESGNGKERIQEFKTLLEFIKWQNEQGGDK
ncbi:helix-turn-helix transcriptional regulator [Bacillus sp. FJAT-50079]|uniref:helix-turn-helix domain-containing protein n=1 Tax=Bacillus sp. FJAT-50079 TaxID=2833577 RepID=UPI001BC99BB0|nr:helix-turn-helix transcriptional regulator [Bacillus sp. FJAT-50079]MBS4209154.1 helix-turn-helix domain-containing protein [Bacillus sp. FJAT-50079]